MNPPPAGLAHALQQLECTPVLQLLPQCLPLLPLLLLRCLLLLPLTLLLAEVQLQAAPLQVQAAWQQTQRHASSKADVQLSQLLLSVYDEAGGLTSLCAIELAVSTCS